MQLFNTRLPANVFENFVACDILNVKHKTILLMEQEWNRDISNKPKLRKYITLEENDISKKTCGFVLPSGRIGLLPIFVGDNLFKIWLGHLSSISTVQAN